MVFSDRTTGLFLAAVGLFFVYRSSLLPSYPGEIGPGAFPMLVSSILLAAGLLIALRSGRHAQQQRPAPPPGPDTAHGPQEPRTAQGPQTGPAQDTPAGQARGVLLARSLLPPTLLAFYYLAAEGLGFLPTAAIIIFIVCRALRGSLALALPLALLAPLLINLVFGGLLRVPLPGGLLPLPFF